MKPIWMYSIAVAVVCGVAVMGAGAQEDLLPAGGDASPCQMKVHVFAPEASFDESEDLRRQAILLFGRLDREDFETAMQGMDPGEARDESDRFKGQDARWRLLRPVETPDDPDAIVIAPTQVQYLVRMPAESQVESLVLVGLPEDGRVIRPALAGRLGADAGEHAGQLFTAEPVSETDPCPVNPAKTAGWATKLVRTELTDRARTNDGAPKNET
ncbi:MAG: hypothetical protein HLUCCO07_06025 [Rhodobacteraceae bacterium HLUCCO07]|nr:MAG: hypothetical protein HLUCCO07_06025 [Rhodobacteraceae bacterium HLUCCO07]